MRSIIMCMLITAILGLLILNTAARSPGKCGPCDKSKCPEVTCSCGSVSDGCNCCDECRKCLGEECSLMIGHACEVGTTCTHPPGTSAADLINKLGTCAHTEEK